MSKKQGEHNKPLTIGDLYPQLTDEQLQEAEENLSQYVQLALQIYERICEDPELYAQFKNLTASKSHPSIHQTKVDSTNTSDSFPPK